MPKFIRRLRRFWLEYQLDLLGDEYYALAKDRRAAQLEAVYRDDGRRLAQIDARIDQICDRRQLLATQLEKLSPS